MTCARFEVAIDGIGRTNRDRKDVALQAGEVLKQKNPNAQVTIRDRLTGDTIVVNWPPPPELAPNAPRRGNTALLTSR